MKFAISPEKLRMLADWFDVKYPDDPDPEVQTDLRLLAGQIELIEKFFSSQKKFGNY